MTFLCTYIYIWLASGGRFKENTISMGREDEERRAEDNIDERKGERKEGTSMRTDQGYTWALLLRHLVEFTLDIRMRAACTRTRTHP